MERLKSRNTPIYIALICIILVGWFIREFYFDFLGFTIPDKYVCINKEINNSKRARYIRGSYSLAQIKRLADENGYSTAIEQEYGVPDTEGSAIRITAQTNQAEYVIRLSRDKESNWEKIDLHYIKIYQLPTSNVCLTPNYEFRKELTEIFQSLELNTDVTTFALIETTHEYPFIHRMNFGLP